ncbi:MAG: hypothetical protein HOJ35_02810 [Bdellovibrionales bacterium]|nr:hypothetical protein [Bdellovibrionales bacterium]
MIIVKTNIKALFFFLSLTTLCAMSPQAKSREMFRRLGLGFTDQSATDLTSLSIKMQTSKYFSFGGVFGIDTSDNGGQIAGIKVYQNLITEPHLTFYASTLLAYLNQKTSNASQSGFQTDITLGSEFSIPKLESIGFSFEFGVSIINLDDLTFKTTGNNIISSAIHFYL